ncbi:BSD domain-containing protein [Abeliophyllum distichum]|uniref:BSD domain-containing protein n=1 Tax=Abeliophyllum distichum TaxID=126358 RepID=A0ABD1Q3B6_9LAMI
MDAYSWFRRSVSKLKKTSMPSSNTNYSQKAIKEEEEEEQFYGITDQLIDVVKSFSIDTFKNFTLPDEGGDDGQNDGNVRKDLSDWQEKHAMLVLSKVKELSHLRFKLCPRYLKEREFWRIYFTLARSYVIEYELHAVRLEKLKKLRTENGTVSNTSACEVEMSEAKQDMGMGPATSLERNLESLQS